MSLPKIRLEHWFIAIVLVAVGLRFWGLSSLPPGITASEANTGLSSLGLLHHHLLWTHGVNPADVAYSWLSALSIVIFGTTTFAIRLVAALAGTVAVVGVYYWLRDERNLRDGLVGAVILASLAWQIGLSREGGAAALVPAVVACWLWVRGRAKATSRPIWLWWSAVLLAGGLYVSPALWWLNAVVVIAWITKFLRSSHRSKRQLTAAAIWAAIALPAVIWIFRSGHRLLHLGVLSGFFGNFIRALNLFLMAGGGWQLTIGGQALLNAFYLIMLTLGILVAIGRWRREGWLLGLWVLSLVAAACAWPNVGAALALGAIPAVGLIVLGIATMLERWYSTFPINSAARGVGRAIVGFILVLAAYQGYVQYFVAFANSSETHDLYHEDYRVVAAQAKVLTSPIIVTDSDAQPILSYFNYPTVPLLATPAAIKAKRVTGSWYLIGYDQKLQMVPILQQVAPGGALVPHYSLFDGRELYFSYRVK